MTKRRIVIFGGVVAAVFLIGTLIASVTAVARSPGTHHPPIIAGQAAPLNVVVIDFDKRYDLHCALLGNQLTVYRKCKIIGFTREGDSDSSGSSVVLSRSSKSYFDAWLVLELEDGRRAYLPPNSLKFMEEAQGN